jgi:hypothetical protein
MKALIIALVCVGTALAVFSVQAQQLTLRANIPFDFRAGATGVMPAGEYSLRTVNGVLVLQNTSRPRIATMLFTSGAYRPQAPAVSSLEFSHYGGTYFLDEVWMTASSQGLAVIPARSEKEFAKQYGGLVERAGVPLIRK